MYGCGTVPSPASSGWKRVVAPTDPLDLPEAAGLSAAPAGEEPLSVLLPPGHPLADRTGLRLPDLADALWLDAPAAAVGLTALRAATGGAFPVSVRYDGTDTGALRMLADAGHGLALLPRSAAGPRAVPLVAPRLVHRVEVVTRPEPGAMARLFTDLPSTAP